jgi:3-oxoacyl-[acyl-carrier protein] reductase
MIIVTGASRGLGNAICNFLIKKNIEVYGIARNVEHLDFPASACDITKPEEIKAIAKKLKSEGKKITGLINTAGVAAMNLAILTPNDVAKKIVETNLLGTIYCSQLFAPLMIRNKDGFIVNFSTIAVALGLKGESIYVASKAGIEAFTRVFAREVGDFNINVNCIAPGPIETDLIQGISDKIINNIMNQQLIRKKYTTETVCDLIDLFMDPKSKSITGEVINIGGV